MYTFEDGSDWANQYEKHTNMYTIDRNPNVYYNFTGVAVEKIFFNMQTHTHTHTLWHTRCLRYLSELGEPWWSALGVVSHFA